MKLLEALEDYVIDKIPTLLNGIYDTGQIIPDISKSIFIAQAKKPGAKEYELLHIERSVLQVKSPKYSLMPVGNSQTSYNRGQCGFAVEKNTTNAPFELLLNRLWENKKRYTYASLTTPRHLTEYSMMR